MKIRTKTVKDMKGGFGGAMNYNSFLWEDMTGYYDKRFLPLLDKLLDKNH
jgi:hypothetical protein